MMRRTPMNRSSGWGAPRTDQEREDAKNKRLRALLGSTPVARGVFAPSTDVVVAVPKDVKARPGKGAQTVEEKKWIEAILSHGCIACWLDGLPSVPACVHHIIRGNQRIGHLFTLPLCDPGHHQAGQQRGMVSRHPWKTRFELKYGCEKTLLNGLQRKLGFPVLEWKP